MCVSIRGIYLPHETVISDHSHVRGRADSPLGNVSTATGRLISPPSYSHSTRIEPHTLPSSPFFPLPLPNAAKLDAMTAI